MSVGEDERQAENLRLQGPDLPYLPSCLVRVEL